MAESTKLLTNYFLGNYKLCFQHEEQKKISIFCDSHIKHRRALNPADEHKVYILKHRAYIRKKQLTRSQIKHRVPKKHALLPYKMLKRQLAAQIQNLVEPDGT